MMRPGPGIGDYGVGMPTNGTVQLWHQELGWGVIESEATPGGTSADASTLRVEAVADLNGVPRMGLRPGTEVEFAWSTVDTPINGCDYVAHAVWPARATPPQRPDTAYSGRLWNSVGDPGPDGLITMREAVIDNADNAQTDPPVLPTTVGIVRLWHDEEGWGVFDSDATPGGAWAHFSGVVGIGFRSLAPGQVVEFDYENRGQDGYDFRATNIRGR